MHVRSDIFAIDLGTTKFCLAALIRHKDKSLMLRTITVPAGGMRRGMLADFEDAQKRLTDLLDQAERQLDRDIRHVVVGIAGSHLRGQPISVTLPIERGEVDHDTLRALCETAESRVSSDTRELLHVVPLTYRVDQRTGTSNPLRFSGKEITGEFFVVDADRAYLKDVIRLCNQCGLEVVRLYSEPFASASVTLKDHHKGQGVAMLDIGGGTSDGLVFRQGRPCGVFTLNVAGAMMTHDLSLGLNIPPDEAERVKLHFGLESASDLTVTDFSGRRRRVTTQEVQQILGARVMELAELLGKALVTYKGTLGAGLVVTGGGAQVKGLKGLLQKTYKIPVAVLEPDLGAAAAQAGTALKDASPMSSPLATALGLLNLEINRLCEDERIKKDFRSRRYLSQFINWLKELS